MNKGRSLEDTSTWAVSIFAFFLFFLSFIIDAGLHRLTKFLRRRKRKSLRRALEKFKTEMMKMGLISLLLAVSEVPIANICVSQAVANSFLPCKDANFESSEPALSSATQASAASEFNSTSNTSTEITNIENYCQSEVMVPLISREGILHLNIFISVLAVFHVLYCLVTMFLGMAKMRRWKAWEDETRTLEYQIANDPRRFQYSDQTSFGKRHLKFWSNNPLLLGPVCLFRQFYNSVSKIDYFTLRNGFITANFAGERNFNFQKYLSRAYDDDFEQVVGIRFWIWIFCILFIFFSAHVFYNHFWLTFIPLGIVLVVGTKLQAIITKMSVETFKQNPVIRGSFVVKPNDDLFWFGKPDWLLHLLQIVLIQNSFQLAFLTWTWFEYGQRSCFHRQPEDLAITISMGVLVQFLCGYVTLPLYALVTQMGSGMKKAVFTENVVEGLKSWHKNARLRLSSKNSSTSSTLRRSSHSWNSDTTTDFSVSEEQSRHVRSSSAEIVQEDEAAEVVNPRELTGKKVDVTTTSIIQSLSSSGETTVVEGENPKMIVARGSYDGEISFGSSWKKLDISKVDSGEVTSITEEEDASVMY